MEPVNHPSKHVRVLEQRRCTHYSIAAGLIQTAVGVSLTPGVAIRNHRDGERFTDGSYLRPITIAVVLHLIYCSAVNCQRSATSSLNHPSKFNRLVHIRLQPNLASKRNLKVTCKVAD
jgi:hypothetical protein